MPPTPIFVALADPTRCRIIEILNEGPQPVHVLAASFAISRPAISRHLRVLKQARLISEKKSGRENLYRLHKKRLEPAQDWLGTVLGNPDAGAPTKPKSTLPAIPKQPAASPTPLSQMGFDF
jgi:DNA-binding transcriptional ArsR family regulator